MLSACQCADKQGSAVHILAGTSNNVHLWPPLLVHQLCDNPSVDLMTLALAKQRNGAHTLQIKNSAEWLPHATAWA